MSTNLPPKTNNSPSSVVASGLKLTAVMLVVLIPVATFGFSNAGTHGIIAAVIACAVCLGCGWLALFITSLGKGPTAANAVLLSTLVRMGAPFAFALMITKQQATLAEAGIFGMIVVNYLCMLGTETYLAVRMTQANPVTATNAQNSEGT